MKGICSKTIEKNMLLKKTFEFARRPTERFYVTGLGISKLVFLGLGARNELKLCSETQNRQSGNVILSLPISVGGCSIVVLNQILNIYN